MFDSGSRVAQNVQWTFAFTRRARRRRPKRSGDQISSGHFSGSNPIAILEEKIYDCGRWIWRILVSGRRTCRKSDNCFSWIRCRLWTYKEGVQIPEKCGLDRKRRDIMGKEYGAMSKMGFQMILDEEKAYMFFVSDVAYVWYSWLYKHTEWKIKLPICSSVSHEIPQTPIRRQNDDVSIYDIKWWNWNSPFRNA